MAGVYAPVAGPPARAARGRSVATEDRPWLKLSFCRPVTRGVWVWYHCPRSRGGASEGFTCREHPMINRAEPKWVPVTRWAALAGNWIFADRSARYEGPSIQGGYGLAICDERFRDGLIRAKMRFEGQDAPLKGESAGIVLGYHSESGGYLVAGLGAFEFAYAIWEFLPACGLDDRMWAAFTRNH